MAFNSIKEYQINTTGSSNGLTIPSGFRIAIMPIAFSPVQDIAGIYATLQMQVCTYANDQHTTIIKNDQVADRIEYNLIEGNLDESVRTVANNKLLPELQSVYGAGNVEVIT